MIQTAPEAFESICLMIELGFYYKDRSGEADLEGLLTRVIAEAISPFANADLATVKVHLDELLSGRYSADELTSVWMRRKPLVAFFEGAGENATPRGLTYVLERLRAAVAAKLAESENE